MADGIPTPVAGPAFPQEIADPASVKAANDAIRDLLRKQSGRDVAEPDRSGEAVEAPKPRKKAAAKADDK